ncbi:St6galnac4p [Branchiostoma belcheri]|nr:St6galnac4p [Branchiostoma belcheri]
MRWSWLDNAVCELSDACTEGHIVLTAMTPCSNNKGRTPFLIGLFMGIILCSLVFSSIYFYLGELRTQPLYVWHAAWSKRLLSWQTGVQTTTVPTTTAWPVRPPGPVHPAPFNGTHPLSGYVSVVKNKEPLKLHCSVCALVFTSGHVLNYTAGAEIDQADCVIRMNHAPVEGYAKHVGNRTTVRVATHSSFKFAYKEITRIFAREKQDKVVVWGPDATMRTDGRGETYRHLANLTKVYKDVEFYMLTPPRMTYAHKLFDKETGLPRGVRTQFWLSTGWFAMILATEMCDRVKVFGMSNGQYCRDPHAHPVSYHYFNKYGGNECQEYHRMERQRSDTHRFFAEKKVFETWSKYHKITFHYPTWRPK